MVSDAELRQAMLIRAHSYALKARFLDEAAEALRAAALAVEQVEKSEVVELEQAQVEVEPPAPVDDRRERARESARLYARRKRAKQKASRAAQVEVEPPAPRDGRSSKFSPEERLARKRAQQAAWSQRKREQRARQKEAAQGAPEARQEPIEPPQATVAALLKVPEVAPTPPRDAAFGGAFMPRAWPNGPVEQLLTSSALPASG